MRPGKAFWVRADALALPFSDKFFHCAITSTPYYRQRKYGNDAREVGREESPDDFAEKIAAAFDDVRRVLRDDGVVFLNIGDTYSTSTGKVNTTGGDSSWLKADGRAEASRVAANRAELAKPKSGGEHRMVRPNGMPQKSLIGIPWRVAFAMMRRGWILRNEIIWAKSIAFGDRHAANVRDAVYRAARKLKLSKMTAEAIAEAVEPQVGSCMPSSASDRCTVSHEQLFMFTKSPTYYTDFEAVKERGKDWGARDRSEWKYRDAGYEAGQSAHSGCEDNDFAEKGRQLRSVWTINTQPVHGMKHYAAYPARLVEPCVKIGTSPMGCCPACGAPVARVVEKAKTTRERPNDYTKRTGEDGTGNACANTVDGVATRTTGWRSTCGCNWFDPANLGAGPVDPVPCRVLDPFGGIGTTAVAGVPLGRDVYVVDLYQNYLDEGRRRFEQGEPKRPARRRAKALAAAE
jgi:DNA modification methylase